MKVLVSHIDQLDDSQVDNLQLDFLIWVEAFRCNDVLWSEVLQHHALRVQVRHLSHQLESNRANAGL